MSEASVATVSKAERIAAKQRADAERQARRQQADAAREARRRDAAAVDARAYENYLRVRDWARGLPEMRDRGLVPLTGAEQEMVAGLAHLWDAPREVIAGLRRACEPITGVRAADYAEARTDLAFRLKYQVGFLRRHVGADLFVQESPLLGGFGAEWHRQVYNEDTARFFKAVAALSDGGVLADCRGQGSRRLVWEIGGGWGGFAFQLKTICPNVTYLITGLPDLLLVSAVYLMTAFPQARCRFDDAASRSELWSDWEQADFIFAPESAVAGMDAPPMHAVLDVMSLRQMSDTRIALHVQRAFDLGARYFFCQETGPCFPEAPPRTWRAIERHYWPHLIPPRIEASAFILDDEQKAPVIDDYAHLVGWRRLPH